MFYFRYLGGTRSGRQACVGFEVPRTGPLQRIVVFNCSVILKLESCLVCACWYHPCNYSCGSRATMSCAFNRKTEQLVSRLRLLLGRLLANMEAAAAAAAPASGADLAVAHCLKFAPCHAEVPQSRFRKTHLKNCACGGPVPQCRFRIVRLKLAPCHA